jgi:transposase
MLARVPGGWQLLSGGNEQPHAQIGRTLMERSWPLTPLKLTSVEQEQLQAWARRRKSARTLALRARIVLACDRGRTNRQIAAKLSVTPQTVGKWRARFLEARAAGLLDQPRTGAPHSIPDELVEAVLAKTLHERPPDAARWSSRRLAQVVGVSQRAVVRIWRDFGVY